MDRLGREIVARRRATPIKRNCRPARNGKRGLDRFQKKERKKRPITPSIHGGGFVLLDLLRAANSLLQLRTNVYDLLPVLQTVV